MSIYALQYRGGALKSTASESPPDYPTTRYLSAVNRRKQRLTHCVGLIPKGQEGVPNEMVLLGIVVGESLDGNLSQMLPSGAVELSTQGLQRKPLKTFRATFDPAVYCVLSRS